MPVNGCMCFVGAELPLVGRPQKGGVVLYQHPLVGRALDKNVLLSDRLIAELTDELLKRFPSA